MEEKEQVEYSRVKNKKRKKKKGFGDYIRMLIMIICVCVFIYSAYNLLKIYLDYKEIDDSYASMRDDYVVELDGYLDIDWEKLLARNPDVIAWVQIPDTNISYPVLKGADNDTYLRHDIDHNYSIAGCIFVEENNEDPFNDLNTILYGHNMKNNSMFSDLKDYLDVGFVETHQYAYVYIPNGTVNQYKVVSAHNIDAYSDIYAQPVIDMQVFYDLMFDQNKLNVEFDKDIEQRIITLSTCATYDVENTSRVAVHAALEREGIDPKTEKMK